MTDDYGLLKTLNPRVRQEMEAKGMGAYQIMEQTGLLGELSRLEMQDLLKKRPELADRFRKEDLKRELASAVSRELELQTDALRQCMSIDEVKAKLGDVVRAAAHTMSQKS